MGERITKHTKTAIALGTFDGLHKGHRAVIAAALAFRSRGLEARILLFDTHPQKVLTGVSPGELMTPTLRERELASLGIKAETVAFDEIKDWEPERFFREILLKRLRCAAVACGEGYRFGRAAAGDAALMETFCRESGLDFTLAETVMDAGEPVSSTRIRKALENGEPELAARMLGRPFSYDFEVVYGRRLARYMGTPTMNQLFDEGFCIPKHGVYLSRVTVEGKQLAAVTNIGVQPTFGGKQLRSETNILDFSGELYGRRIEVALLRYLRAEMKFRSLGALREQIGSDSAKAREFFPLYGPDGLQLNE